MTPGKRLVAFLAIATTALSPAFAVEDDNALSFAFASQAGSGIYNI